MREGREGGWEKRDRVYSGNVGNVSYFHATNPSLLLIEAFVFGSLPMGTSVIRYVP